MRMKKILTLILILSFTINFARAYKETDFQNNPNFIGEWRDRTQVFERTLRIEKLYNTNNDYQYGISIKTENLKTGFVSDFKPIFIGALDKNTLRAKTEKGSTSSFHILKNGKLTDNNFYLMQRIK